MLWGGLRPIPSRLLLDCLTIASLFSCAATSPDVANDAALVLSCLTTLATAGPTSRWTISFPMVPFVLLQGSRRAFDLGGSPWTGVLVGALSVILLIISTALTVLFPAVELGPIHGEFNVGVVDLHLPVDFTEGVRRGSLLGTQHQDSCDDPSGSYVSARLLYPTRQDPRDLPYLDPERADPKVVCSEFMKAGAPGPLKSFGWMLHNWRLITIRARKNARPASDGGPFPLAIYSHGLIGNAAIYSYQALNLAANGMVVVMVDHTDESAIAIRRRDSSHLLYDPSLIVNLSSNGNEEEYDRKRRAQTEHRAEECLSALKVLRTLNRRNIPDLESVGVSFMDRLDVSDVTLIGHSFGGATVLTAAARCSHSISAVVAHDPAVGWIPDWARQKIFPPEEEGESGKEVEEGDCLTERVIHNANMLCLYCEEWADKGWGHYKQVKRMHKAHADGTVSFEVGVIRKAHHSEFSDTCMITPLWLARATGLTGERNPHETAEEIACRTIEFLESNRRSKRT